MYNASQVHRFGGGGGGSSVNSPTQDREHNIREMTEVAFRNRKRREDTAVKHSILLIRVEYNGHTPTYCDEDCVKSNMWTGEKNVAGMYNEASYGAVQFEDMGDKGKVITVQVKKGTAESATTCKFWQIAAEADAAARKMGVEPKDFMHQSYYLPRTGVGHCTFGGLGFLGCGKDNCKSWIRYSNYRTRVYTFITRPPATHKFTKACVCARVYDTTAYSFSLGVGSKQAAFCHLC